MPRIWCSTARALSSGSKSVSPKFDPAMVKVYNALSENHRHIRGPWTLMTQQAVSLTKRLDVPTILDLATGPGEPAKSIAMALPNASIIATDVSEDMIAAATKNNEDLDNVRCVLADAQNLSDFESDSVDVVTCCYGYMFTTDKAVALSETLRVLKPGGTLIATTWDNVDIPKINRDIMTEILGQVPPPPSLNPMALSEEGLFLKLVEDAGFTDVTQTTSTYPFNFGPDKEFQFTVGTLLVREKLNEIAESDDEAWNKAEKAFWSNIGNYTEIDEDSGDMVMSNNTFRLTIAKKA